MDGSARPAFRTVWRRGRWRGAHRRAGMRNLFTGLGIVGVNILDFF